MTVSAVVFDFDGLVLETEEPIFVAWKEIWADHGHDLLLEDWARCIGTAIEDATFHPLRELSARCGGRALDDAELERVASTRAEALLGGADVLPGVLSWVAEAEAAGLAVAIASSSPRGWIVSHLERLGHLERFPVIACYDDVLVHKPAPAVYLAACAQLGVEPPDALAVEDSAHGVAAAKAAGLACVAVPTAMTSHMDFSAADLVVPSLASLSLADVIEQLAGVR